MTPRPLSRAAALFLTSVLLALAACGDDLESRQAALDQPQGGEIMIGAQETSAVSGTMPAAPAPGAPQGFDDAGDNGSMDEEETVFDAEPEMLIDDAQGFDTAPIDDTSGFDPSPGTAESFGE